MEAFKIPQFGDDELKIRIEQYAEGANARVRIVSLLGEPYYTISVNLPKFRLPEDEFIFKT